MKNPRSLRLALSRSLLVSSLLAAPAFALTSAEFDSLRAKADRGNAIAQYNLGLAYSDRREALYDPVQAYAWLSLAATNGTHGKALATLAAQLTPEQIAEGKRRFAALSSSPVSPVAAPASPLASAAEPAPAPLAPAITAEPDPDQKKLSAELAAAWKENALLKSGLNAQLADANKRVAIAEAALASKDKQIATLQATLSSATIAPAPAPAAATSELAALRNERDQLQSAVTTAAGELAALRTAATKAAADLTTARRAQTLAEAEIASLKATADRASAERLAVAAQLETTAVELAAAKAAVAAKSAETPGLSATGLATLKADRDALAASVKTLTDERDALTAQLAAAKAVVPVAPAPSVVTEPIPLASVPTAPSAPDAGAEAAAKLAGLEKAKAETDTKLEAALRSFTLQQAEIDRLQKALASIDNERAATATKLDTASAELTALRPQAATAATLSTEADALRAQLAAANQSLADKTAALAAANQSLADSRKTIDSATTELVTTRDQLRQTQAQSAVFAIENQQLKTRLALAGSLPSSPAPSRPGTVPAISVSIPAAPAPAAPPADTPAAPRTHTVVSGDSLSRISKQYYGTAARWNDILQANKAVITNPDALTLGTKLRIP